MILPRTRRKTTLWRAYMAEYDSEDDLTYTTKDDSYGDLIVHIILLEML